MVAPLPDRIERVVHYAQSIETVWNALTHPDELVHWMCTSVQPYTLAPGETLHFTWDNEQFRAIIETVSPPHTFAWRWRPGSGEDFDIPLEEQGPLTIVRFELQSVNSGTRLTLIETGFAALTGARNRLALSENNGGWDDCLAHLGRVLASNG